MATTQRNTLAAIARGEAVSVDAERALWAAGLVTMHTITRGPGGRPLDRSQWTRKAILTTAGKATLEAT